MEGAIEKNPLDSKEKILTKDDLLDIETEELKKEFDKRDIADACRKLIEKRDIGGLYNLGKVLQGAGREKEAAEIYAKASKLAS